MEKQEKKAVENIVIKVEPLDADVENTGDACTSSSSKQEVAVGCFSVKPSELDKLFSLPSMAVHSYKQLFSGTVKEEEGNSDSETSSNRAFQRFKEKIFSAIKLEFPRATDEERHDIAVTRWKILTEEQRRGFAKEITEDIVEKERAEENANAIRQYQPWASKHLSQGIANQIQEIRLPVEAVSTDHIREINKIGACTWCKTFASLNDYSSTIKGREIYCTGLCSQKCFEQAALKICNVECGYDMSRQVLPRAQPSEIKITLPTAGMENSTRSREEDSIQQRNDIPQQSILHVPVAGEKRISVARKDRPVEMNNADSSEELYNIAENTFDWNDYLEKTVSSAAPISCFKQSRISVHNGFKVNMKVECRDPNQDSVYCVATVITVLGPRIRLRFDGTEKMDDIWRLTDSDDIRPVGWCQTTNRGILGQPVGSLMYKSKYMEYIKKSLQNAELAPPSLFLREPPMPRENNFRPFMKLEAVVKNNPALIGVATVSQIDNNRVKIDFDGYAGSGYWTCYSDRDLFYAGWCYANGYPLQPPGIVDSASRDQTSRLVSPDRTQSNFNLRKSYIPMACFGEVDVHINKECDPGPYLDAEKVGLIPTKYQGGIAVVLKSILEDLIQCAFDAKTVFGFLKPGRGNIVINAECDGIVYKCYLSNVDRVSTFWKVMEQFGDNLRCCSNLISGFQLQTTCPLCSRGASMKQALACGQKRRTSPNQTTENIVSCSSNTPDSTAVNVINEESVAGHRELARETQKKPRLEYVDTDLSTSPRSWSVDEVVEFIEKTDLKDFISVFRDNDIDGKALMLLNQDIVINYMGLKIGPAVKLLVMINELKEAAANWT